jgi:hypothetical protein
MEISLNKRYNGIISIDRACEMLDEVKFNFLFSFKFVETINSENGEYLINHFNPHLSSCLLSHFNKFVFYYRKNSKNFIISANILEKSHSGMVVKLNKDLVIPEKRRYDRFKLSPQDLPPFSIYKNGEKVVENARIIEISLRGLQIITPEIQLNNEDLIEVKNEKENVNIGLVKPVVLDKIGKNIIIRGEIQKTNTNITKIVIETYIKVAKEIINTYCKKG